LFHLSGKFLAAVFLSYSLKFAFGHTFAGCPEENPKEGHYRTPK
jgi:hypothetical protein